MATREVTVLLPRPHLHQQQVLSESSRFNVLCCGRRWGKTILAQDRIIRSALAGMPTAYFCPTYRMLSDVWRSTAFKLQAVTRIRNASEYRIELFVGRTATIDFWSLDRPDVARGRAYGMVVVDEAAMVDGLSDVWHAVLRPTLVDHRGLAWFMSTPRGFNFFHELYSLGQDSDQTDWASWRMPSSTNPHLPAEDLEAARAGTDPVTYSQEYQAEFTMRAGLVHYQFSRQHNVRDDIKDLGTEVRVGLDFNVDPMTAVLWSKASDEAHVWDVIELRNAGTEDMAQELARRYQGRQVLVYPDPSGMARKTSAPVGQTDFTILKRHGFHLRAPSSAPLVVDRINEVNAMICSSSGRRRLFIHPRCKPLIAALEQYSYKEKTSVPDKSQGFDHLCDALGYAIHVEFPLRPEGARFKFGFGG
jgi:hypothetical protein